jgi:3'-phosphoadenosine 5'-phosphosulfate sulfotransferase (PAPS reductase)/FAD synthetase
MAKTNAEMLQELKDAPVHMEEAVSTIKQYRRLVFQIPKESTTTLEEYVNAIKELS